MALPLRPIVAAVLLAGCTPSDVDTLEYAIPADGQTRVPADMSLVAYLPRLDLPGDYPTAQVIRVVDLRSGGFVAGTVERDGPAWWFTPAAPWRRDRRFAWTVDAPPDLAHGPQALSGDTLSDGLVFGTSTDLEGIAAATSADGEACIVFSGPIGASALASARLSVDDQSVSSPAFYLLEDDEWMPSPTPIAPDGDLGLSVACAAGAAAGDHLRLWLGDRSPMLLEISAEHPSIAVSDLYRRSM